MIVRVDECSRCHNYYEPELMETIDGKDVCLICIEKEEKQYN